MMLFSRSVWLAIAAGMAFTAASQVRADIGYQFVTVGNPGNANDPATGSLYGGVSYTYGIGKYDVTEGQYTTFLNAVASSDPYGLYNSSMATTGNASGVNNGFGITQSGASGSYSYSVNAAYANLPVTYVNWFDAARMANWMQNGQPTGLGEVAGSTERGAYTLDGDISSGLETKNASATYWIPSESEWYKAAYYDPNYGGPGVGGYWTYATRSNALPGNVVGSGANQANYNNGFYSVTQSGSYSSTQNYLTDVGAFTNSESAYGTYDQAGDVYNWNDAVVGSSRGLRGGLWDAYSANLPSSFRNDKPPANEYYDVGFRLASVPEPSSVMLMAIAVFFPLLKRPRRTH